MTRLTETTLAGLALVAATLAAAPGWVGVAAWEPPAAVSMPINELPMPAVEQTPQAIFDLS